MPRPRSRLPVVLVAAAAGAAGVALLRPTRPPAADGSPPARFTDVTAAAGVGFRHFTGANGRKLLPETMAGGVVVLDFDGDGRPDLFFTNARPWPGDPDPPTGRPTQALYRNNGDGTFADVTAAAGLDVTLYGMGAAAGDFDNDGRPDLFVTAVGGDRLFRNVDGTRFEDVTARAAVGGAGLPDVSAERFRAWAEPVLFPASAAWLDFDGDGKLDLFVCRYLTWSPAADLGVRAELPGGLRAYVPPTQFPAADCILYRNNGDGTFTDVSASAGVAVHEPTGGDPRPRPIGKALGVAVCDPDGDSWPDVVVACDTVRNLFFHNVPAPGGRRFAEIGMAAGVALSDGRPRGGMGVDVGFVRPDAPSVVVANFSNEPASLFTLLSPDRLRFTDTAAADGLAATSRGPMKFGAFLFDYDGDGRADLLVCNGHLEPDIAAAQPGERHPQPPQLFLNGGRADRRLVPVPAGDPPGDLFRPLVGRGSAFLDMDADGDPDVVLAANNGPPRLLRNDTNGAHWLRLTLAGDGRTVNRDAIGAAVTVEAGGVVQRFYMTGSRGYLSGSELTLCVGLGPPTAADRVTVRWPNAGRPDQEYRDLAAGRAYRLTAGDPVARTVAAGGR